MVNMFVKMNFPPLLIITFPMAFGSAWRTDWIMAWLPPISSAISRAKSVMYCTFVFGFGCARCGSADRGSAGPRSAVRCWAPPPSAASASG
eukprot:5405305-Pyramimonas_sp.AAC.1